VPDRYVLKNSLTRLPEEMALDQFHRSFTIGNLAGVSGA
jgi:hypothetical protein